MARHLEVLLEQVGGCGLYQVILVPLSFLCVPLAVWSMLLMVFGALEPDWWCESRGTNTTSSGNASADGLFGTTAATSGNISLHISSDGEETGEKEVLTNGHQRQCEGVCERIIFASGANTVVSEFQLVCGLSWVPAMIISIQMVGVLLGAFAGGQMGDSLGRKKTLITMTVLHAVLPLVAAFSYSWQMFAVMRVLIGVTVGGILATYFGYPAEFVGIKWRALLGSVPIWGVGVMTFSLVVWALRDWRHIHIATAVCTAATLPSWIFLPESVRWLSIKGHVNKAHRVLQNMARWNGREAPDGEQLRKFFSDREDTSRQFTYFHIFAGWNMAKMSLIIGYMWSACSLSYYGLSFGIKNLAGDFYLNLFLMAVVEVPPTFFIHPLFSWFGRRWTCAVAFLIASVSSFAIVPVHFFASAELAGTCITVLALLARACTMFGWNAITVFHAELYPTVVRNIGLGFGNTTARIGGILAPYILVGGNNKEYVFYIIVGVVMAFNFVSPLLLRETGGRPLEDDLARSNKEVEVVVTASAHSAGKPSAV